MPLLFPLCKNFKMLGIKYVIYCAADGVHTDLLFNGAGHIQSYALIRAMHSSLLCLNLLS